MEENKMLEKIWSEAQTIEVPKDLSPEQMRERIEGQAKEEALKKKCDGRQEKRNIFQWHGYGSRVAAAAVVLVLSLGAYGVADRQSAHEPPVGQETDKASDPAAPEDDKDLVQAGDAQNDKEPDEERVTAVDEAEVPVVKQLGDYHLAESYEEVYQMAANMQGWLYRNLKGEALTGAADDSVYEGAASDSSSRADGASEKKMEQAFEKADFSTTNLQVTGVDESDIVKTDGKNIYIAAGDQVRMVDVTTGVPRQLGSIKPQLNGNMDSICEMYVSDDRLLLIVQTEETEMMILEDAAASKMALEDVAWGYGYDYSSFRTQVLTYDITIPAGAKLIGAYEQDGRYENSRKIGNQLYLFTRYGFTSLLLYGEERSFDEELSEDADRQIRLPQVQGQTVPENCIYLPKDGASTGVVISAMDITRPEEVGDQKFILTGGGELYVTAKSIYLYEVRYDAASDRQRTSLSRFKLGDGRITADCAEAVAGVVEDTFAIHETADGYVYVLTTDYNKSGTTNQLFVLDDKLKICGKIDHIADGEMVYAARFVDDIGYFVTYRNMDPLFTVDFSDPKHPTLIGELEIPGFSDYLQFWDEEHLIGVGEERKESDSEFVGIKVSLYDISDPTEVKETSKVVIDDAYGSPATNNYKALLADSGKNVIAFLTDDKDNGGGYSVSQHIFTVKDGKLVRKAKEKLEEGFDAWNSRNLYIADNLYLVAERRVAVYDMTDGFKQTQVLSLD